MAESGPSSDQGVSTPLVAKPDHHAAQNVRSHCVYTRMASCSLPGLESLGYTLGKTLGSGTYAKVKATWSARHEKMVIYLLYNLASYYCNAKVSPLANELYSQLTSQL